MKRIPVIFPALLVMALAGGCVVSGSARVRTTQPTLVYVSPGVQVVEDYHEPVFYSDGYYWRYYGNVWYRSSYHTGGWVTVRTVPAHVRRIDRPHTYVRYRGNAHGRHGTQPSRSHVRDHRDNRREPARGNVRDHRDNRREPARGNVRDHRAGHPSNSGHVRGGGNTRTHDDNRDKSKHRDRGKAHPRDDKDRGKDDKNKGRGKGR
jgi:hypothetical protein